MNTRRFLDGDSTAARVLAQEMDLAARCAATVLVTGETAIGRKSVARNVHERSARSGPLVSIHVAEVPETTLALELFGSALAGGADGRVGWLHLAKGGTLFVDEIGEACPQMQTRFMEYLDVRDARPVSGNPAVNNVRLIVGSSGRLFDRVQRKSFREDLYYRLNVVHLEVPSLRALRSERQLEVARVGDLPRREPSGDICPG